MVSDFFFSSSLWLLIAIMVKTCTNTGVALTLPPESEEVAGFFGALLETDYAQDAKFRENFFRDFKAIVEKYPPKEDVKIKKLEKCDFRPMFEYFEKEKEKKKALTKEEKKA